MSMADIILSITVSLRACKDIELCAKGPIIYNFAIMQDKLLTDNADTLQDSQWV